MQERMSVEVQKMLRRFLGRKRYFQLRAEAYDRLVVEKITLI